MLEERLDYLSIISLGNIIDSCHMYDQKYVPKI